MASAAHVIFRCPHTICQTATRLKWHADSCQGHLQSVSTLPDACAQEEACRCAVGQSCKTTPWRALLGRGVLRQR